MTRRYRTWRQRRWTELLRWVEVLWLCRCSYHNVSTPRCYFCGKRPPAEVRALVAGVPLPD